MFVGVLACAGFAGEGPRHAHVRLLKSDRLLVEVMEPETAGRYYQGNRFSPVADVLRVTMDGRDFLFSPVEHDSLKENAGLAMEFDLLQWPGGPPGFAEAAVGEPFLKVGVGLLKKTEGEYGFYKPYETLAVAPTTAEWGVDRVRFRQDCETTIGYGYVFEAEVVVQGRKVEITCRLQNTGQKPFATEQYAHNYFCFDGAVVGPGYELEFSRDFTLEQKGSQPPLQRSGLDLVLTSVIPGKKAINARVVLAARAPAGEETVVVKHPASGMSVRASISQPTSHVAVHAVPSYLCPEQFVRFRLLPGEAVDWVRTYEFILDKPFCDEPG